MWYLTKFLTDVVLYDMWTLYFVLISLLVNRAVLVSSGEPGVVAKKLYLLEPSAEFSYHEVILPQVTVRGIPQNVTTLRKNGYDEQIAVSFQAFGTLFTVDLHRNRDLFSKSYIEKYFLNGAAIIRRNTDVENIEGHCHYHGNLRGLNDSSAALSTCAGISGYVSDGQELYHIEPSELNAAEHFIYRSSDAKPRDKKCGTGSESSQHSFHAFDNNELHEHLRRKRQLSDPYGATTEEHPNFVELFLVNDHTMYEQWDDDVDTVILRSQQIANTVNMLYKPLNIFIVLVGVEVWTDEDKIELSNDGDETLARFLKYRREFIIPDHPNDNTQLISGYSVFTNGVVGKAYKGLMCSFQFSAGVIADHSKQVMPVASTVAHEMGHNFGMEHDTEECQCNAKKCIMHSASSGDFFSPDTWSDCSVANLHLFLKRGIDWCLHDKPDMVFKGPICGDGFVDGDEACDCGPEELCDSPCCDPKTCQLFANATCGTGVCCDLNTCKLKSKSMECRISNDECDLPEFCTGESEFCPPNVWKQDAVPCSGGKGHCYGGKCGSEDLQCKLLWGQTARVAHPSCYNYNRRGSTTGNCGFDALQNKYVACSKVNVRCGRLQCRPLSTKPEFGIDSGTIQGRHAVGTVDAGLQSCHTLQIDMGVSVLDPGMVPNGAICETGKVCVDQECRPVTEVFDKTCQETCHGQGVCNNIGNCHCNFGYAPPFCTRPGVGGSQDSGPPFTIKGKNNYLFAMLALFLLVVPIVAITLVLLCVKTNVFKTCVNLSAVKTVDHSQDGSLHGSGPASPSKPGGVRPAPTKPATNKRFNIGNKQINKTPSIPASTPESPKTEPLLPNGLNQEKDTSAQKSRAGLSKALSHREQRVNNPAISKAYSQKTSSTSSQPLINNQQQSKNNVWSTAASGTHMTKHAPPWNADKDATSSGGNVVPVRAAPSVPSEGSEPISPTRTAPAPPPPSTNQDVTQVAGRVAQLRAVTIPKIPPRPENYTPTKLEAISDENLPVKTSVKADSSVNRSESLVAQRAKMIDKMLANRSSPSSSPKLGVKFSKK